jgi:hypothetical protein
VLPLSIVEVVGQPANVATRGNWSSRVRSDPSGLTPVVAMPGVSFQSLALALGQPASDPIVSLSFVGRAEARSAGFRNPEGITRCVQVSRYKVEPSISVCSRNLLASDDLRTALLDEIVE